MFSGTPQMFPDVFRNSSDVSRCFQELLGCSQGVPGEFPGVPRCSQVFPGVPRCSQMFLVSCEES